MNKKDAREVEKEVEKELEYVDKQPLMGKRTAIWIIIIIFVGVLLLFVSSFFGALFVVKKYGLWGI